MPPDSADDLARVTPALLRQAESMCPRRLYFEHELDRKPSHLGDAPFEVANRLVQDAITWHKAGDPQVPGFPDPLDLEPEQRAVYRAASDVYARNFAAPVDVDDLMWSTEFPDLGVRLVSPVGIPLIHDDGTRELRMVRLGGRELLVDTIELQCVTLRAHRWAPEGFRVHVVDLIEDRSVEYDIDVAARLDDALAWFEERVGAIRARANKQRAVTGADCRFCSCIPGCPQITVAS
jgi:hypothetical protein